MDRVVRVEDDAHTAGGGFGDAQQALVANGGAMGNGDPVRLPTAFLQARLPAFDVEGRHALSERYVLLQHNDVELSGIGHADV